MSPCVNFFFFLNRTWQYRYKRVLPAARWCTLNEHDNAKLHRRIHDRVTTLHPSDFFSKQVLIPKVFSSLFLSLSTLGGVLSLFHRPCTYYIELTEQESLTLYDIRVFEEVEIPSLQTVAESANFESRFQSIQYGDRSAAANGAMLHVYRNCKRAWELVNAINIAQLSPLHSHITDKTLWARPRCAYGL